MTATTALTIRSSLSRMGAAASMIVADPHGVVRHHLTASKSARQRPVAGRQ
jgi:hypothetical protein